MRLHRVASGWSVALGLGCLLDVGAVAAQTELDPERDQNPFGVEREAEDESEDVAEPTPPADAPPADAPPADAPPSTGPADAGPAPPMAPTPGQQPPPFAAEVTSESEVGAAGDAATLDSSFELGPLALDETEPAPAPGAALPHPVETTGIAFVPGQGLRLESADREFSLSTSVRLQALYFNQNNESEPAVEGADGDARHGFGLRRARTIFSGHFLGEENRFWLQLAFSPDDVGQSTGYAEHAQPVTTSPLLDAYLDFEYCNFATLRVGQGFTPHTRERRIQSYHHQLVDRSIVNQEFNLDRDTGVGIHADDLLDLGLLRYAVGVYSARGRNANIPKENFGLSYVARVEVLPLGMFDDYIQADLGVSTGPKLSIGASYARIQNAITNRGILGQPPTDGGSTDINSYSGDVVFKAHGLSALVEGVLRRARRDADSVNPLFEAGRDAFGWLAQAGYVIPTTRLELAARAAQVRFNASTNLPDEFEYGGGLNYYLSGHDFKVQADYLRLGQQVLDPTNGESQGTDFLTQVRVQLQAGF